MDVGDVMAIFHRMEPDLIGGPMHHAALHATASQHHGEAKNVMVPAIRPLPSQRRWPGLSPGHDEREKTLLRQIPDPDTYGACPGHLRTNSAYGAAHCG